MKPTKPLLAHDYVRSDKMGPDYLAKKFARIQRQLAKPQPSNVAPLKRKA